MTPAELLQDAFGRIVEGGTAVVDGLSDDQLTHRIAPGTNTIAWLVWHLARGQDAQVAGVAGHEQVWTAQGYAERFGLPFDVRTTGYGQSAEEVGQVRVSADLLADYLRATHEATVGWLAQVSAEDLDRVVDERWDPPVTLGVRLVSILEDDIQHLGQANLIRGILERS
ncbi:mycothiol transferase [Nocardioides nematodiphilus]|uniref:mycothiol transferase n=1 Tax=Nocardioides nematodiphilus TaxID=2849669 RepID=UPI001CD93CBF|nr:DinB family protein [Nocardioides nematodiphilus]MCA1981843.1 DinB family protein [Nocardioides nematodiphilus]